MPVELDPGGTPNRSVEAVAVAAMYENGIVSPGLVYRAATVARLPLRYGCALLEKESGGGRNEWGHDPTIFVGGYDAATGHAYGERVTEAAYAAYKAERVRTNKMQGVGPCQLTWYGYQDAADSLGGCWRPEWNMRVGFGLLRSLVARYGERQGASAYNGAGPAAQAYGEDFARRAAHWHALLT